MDSAAFARSINAHTNPRSCNRLGAERDAWLVRLAQVGPLWIEGLLQVRLFGTRQVARRRLRRLEEDGRLRFAGRASLDGRKPVHLWCNRKIPQAMLRHELDVMRVFLAYWPHAYALTGEDVDPRHRADMELTIGQPGSGRTYAVEVDEGTEPLSQVRRRLSVYDGCPRTVLFVAPIQTRADEVLTLTANPRIYATTTGRCLSDPWGEPWRNCLGEPGRVETP